MPSLVSLNPICQIDTDWVAVTVGSRANPLDFSSTQDLQLNKRGYIIKDSVSGKPAKEAVRAGGDIVTGAAAVIPAKGAGLNAANSIHNYLAWGWKQTSYRYERIRTRHKGKTSLVAQTAAQRARI
jgi:NADPH-dependent glutamate synthase beta subunit-like oxidoreductase